MRSQLQAQYMVEAVIVATVSLVLAAGIALWLLPLLNRVSGKHIPVSQLFSIQALPVALAIVVGIGLLAGSYPASPAHPWQRGGQSQKRYLQYRAQPASECIGDNTVHGFDHPDGLLQHCV